MKNLLVAIDFSRNAIHALDYALIYAKQFGADVTMIWVDNVSGPDLAIDFQDGAARHESRELFKEIQDKYQKKYTAGKLSFKLCKGKVYDEISKHARKMGADLIFAGTHGVTGFEEYWIGSNAYRIVTHAPCPVVTLRQDFDFGKSVKKILMPIDSTSESSKKVYTTAEVATAFGSEVQVLALHTTKLTSLKKQVDRHLKTVSEHLKDKKVSFKVNEITTKNLTRDTIDFAVKNGVDLVAIMTEQETTQANVFLGTFARQLVNNCPVPVISVRVPTNKK
jgi:nucleotide-binding universal stress UspA family protein